VIFLAQLGADGRDPRVVAGCEYVLDHARSSYGGFSAGASPSGMIHCLAGNLAATMLDLGWLGDARLDAALDWLARSITGEGIAPAEEKNASSRYYRSGNSAPGFACSANNHLPCAWGAVKAMLALGKVPEPVRTPATRAAIAAGIGFLFSRDPAVADYPMGYAAKPSQSWFRFGYPDRLRDRRAPDAGGAGRARLRRRCAPASPALDLVLRQAGSPGALEAGVHLQRQDVGGGRGEGQAEQVGDAARVACVERDGILEVARTRAGWQDRREMDSVVGLLRLFADSRAVVSR
jgi:hypothetical protein